MLLLTRAVHFMNIKETKTKSIEFWNEHFKNLQSFKIQKSDIVLDTPLDECLKFVRGIHSCFSVQIIATINNEFVFY